MANPEHVEILKKSVKAWNKWRKYNPDILPDLKGADLREADLREANLTVADLEGANLTVADLEGANLTVANLGGAYLGEANLVEANLEGTNLRYADLREADLEWADLEGADLRGADLEGANVKGTILEDKSKPESKASSLAAMERSFLSKLETQHKEFTKKIENKQFNKDNERLTEKIISKKIEERLSGDIVSALGEEVAKQAEGYDKRKSVQSKIDEIFTNIATRNGDKADKAEKAAKEFRLYGFICASLGLSVTFINVIVWLMFETSSTELFDILGHMPFIVPFILLSEVLAFVMFRYYSKSLEQMRSYTNELTTLDLHQTGASIIIEYGSSNDVVKLGKALMNAERNRVLGKGENTIETLQSMYDTDALSKLLDIIPKLQTLQNGGGDGKNKPPE